MLDEMKNKVMAEFLSIAIKVEQRQHDRWRHINTLTESLMRCTAAVEW